MKATHYLKGCLFFVVSLYATVQSATGQEDNKRTGEIQSQFSLSAQQNEPSTPAILYGHAQTSSLDAHADSSALRGRASSSSISTVQHKGVVDSGFTPLKPLFAPDLSKALEAELARSRPRLNAESSHAIQQLQVELSCPKPKLRPEFAYPQQQTAPNLTPDLETELSNSKVQIDPNIKQAELQMKAELIHAKHQSVPYLCPELKTQLAHPHSNAPVTGDSQQIELELSRAKSYSAAGVSSKIEAELAHSRQKTKVKLLRVKPEIEAVFNLPRKPPELTMPAARIQNTGGTEDFERVISWDEWYARIAKMSEPRLLAAVTRRGNPSGSNTVEITVWPNHHLVVTLIQGNNPNFDAATLEAYRSLDGSPVLQYPNGSSRQAVTFSVDNRHNTPDAVSSVNSITCIGDKEVQRSRRKILTAGEE